eukprot:Pgem_evm1s9133
MDDESIDDDDGMDVLDICDRSNSLKELQQKHLCLVNWGTDSRAKHAMKELIQHQYNQMVGQKFPKYVKTTKNNNYNNDNDNDSDIDNDNDSDNDNDNDSDNDNDNDNNDNDNNDNNANDKDSDSDNDNDNDNDNNENDNNKLNNNNNNNNDTKRRRITFFIKNYHGPYSGVSIRLQAPNSAEAAGVFAPMIWFNSLFYYNSRLCSFARNLIKKPSFTSV